jgi:hypothetical protein
MSSEADNAAPRQERRVAAWIYVVINPILDGLSREITFLARGNLTWRAATSRCEYIRTVQEYVDSRQWPNYKDFLAENRSFQQFFDLHDANLQELNSGAREVYKSLLSGNTFSLQVETLLSRYDQERATLGPQYPSFNLVRKELVTAAAEYLINNIRELPEHYLYSFFWNSLGKTLLSLREQLPIFDIIEPLIFGMSDRSSALNAELEASRLAFSRKYDVPAAYVPGVSLEQ